ncbi:unnamed protein product [Mucor fragilis]
MALATKDPYASAQLQGKDYGLGRLVYGAFIEEIPIGYNVCRGYAGETCADQLRLSSTKKARDKVLEKASTLVRLTDIDEQEEVWKPMNRGRRIYRNLQGRVEVSSEGRVKIDGLIQAQYKVQGYLLLLQKQHWYFVHRMVAATFVSNPDPHRPKIVNHMNLNRSCNKVWNLEWVSASENTAHAWGRPVVVTDERDGSTAKFLTMKAARKRFKVCLNELEKFVSVREQDKTIYDGNANNEEEIEQTVTPVMQNNSDIVGELDLEHMDSSDEEYLFGSDEGITDEEDNDDMPYTITDSQQKLMQNYYADHQSHIYNENVMGTPDIEYYISEEEHALSEKSSTLSSKESRQQTEVNNMSQYLSEVFLRDTRITHLVENAPESANTYSMLNRDYYNSEDDKDVEDDDKDIKENVDKLIKYKHKRNHDIDTSEDDEDVEEDDDKYIKGRPYRPPPRKVTDHPLPPKNSYRPPKITEHLNQIHKIFLFVPA